MKMITRIAMVTFMMVGICAATRQSTGPSSTSQSIQPPALSPIEQLELQNLQLRINDINRDARDFIGAVEAAHPGWTINIGTGQMVQKTTTKSEGSKDKEKSNIPASEKKQ